MTCDIKAAAEMPPDSPTEGATQPPHPVPRDYPHTTPHVQSHISIAPRTRSPAPNELPPSMSTKEKVSASFVFNSSTSQDWVRETNVERGRPTLTAFPSFSSSASEQTACSGSSEPPWRRSSNWQRSREYQTRLTAGECHAHAFEDTRQTLEWKRTRTISTISNGSTGNDKANSPPELSSASKSNPVHIASPLGLDNTESSNSSVKLTRRRSSGLALAFQRALRENGRYVPPPKGTFTSSSRFTRRRFSEFDLRAPAPPPQNASAPVPPASSNSLNISVDASPPAPFAAICSYVECSPVVPERLPTREEWKIRSTERRLERRRDQEEHSASSNDSEGSLFDFPLRMNPEPISISSNNVGGCVGLEAAPPADIRRHSSLSRKESRFQAKSQLQPQPKPKAPIDTLPRQNSPRNPRSVLGEGPNGHGRGKTWMSVSLSSKNVEDPEDIDNVNEDITFALRKLEIISQVALLMNAQEELVCPAAH